MSSPLPFFTDLFISRTQFSTDYIYVLSLTESARQWEEESLPLPEGFDARRVAVQLLSLGKHRTHQYLGRKQAR
jgi:hypothetical protein